MNQPFAVFDLDGTLIRWQLYHALGDELVRQGIIDPTDFAVVKQARMNWKKRSHSDSFKAYELALIKVIDGAMSGLKVNQLELAFNKVINEYKDQVYTYTRELIEELKANNYRLFAISASHADMVKMIAEHYGFDDFSGTEYAVKDGTYTGEKDVIKLNRKTDKLRELAKKYQCTYEASIAVGDSEGDIPMLEIVELPIAFNPTQALFDHAKQHNWAVVVERKNVVYELEPHERSYILA